MLKYLNTVLKSTLLIESVGNILLSHDVVSGGDITPCNKIDIPLVDYRFLGNIMMSIIMLRKIRENLAIFTPKMQF